MREFLSVFTCKELKKSFELAKKTKLNMNFLHPFNLLLLI